MILTINGKKEEIKEGMTVSRLLEVKKIRPEVVTVELNENIIERKSYPEVKLNPNDKLEFVYYMGGGSTPPPSAASLTIQESNHNNRRRTYAIFR